MTSVVAPNPAITALALNYANDRGPIGRMVLPLNRVVTIGRALDVELRLSDGLTSRRHAEICVEDSEVVIEDLESANGTFVNGRKVRRAVLQPGDRVLIGITTFELTFEVPAVAKGTARIPHAPISKTTAKIAPAPPPTRGHDSETTIVGTARIMSGSVKEIPLADLLQLLSNTRKSGLLLVRHQRDTGQVFIRDGRICHATLNDSVAVQPERTLFRMLRWQTGFFELHPLGNASFTEDIQDSADALLLEAARQQDEIIDVERQLPRLDARLIIPDDLPGEISDLSPAEFDALQLVLEHGVVLKVVDAFKGSDLDAYRAVIRLLQAGYVVAE